MLRLWGIGRPGEAMPQLATAPGQHRTVYSTPAPSPVLAGASTHTSDLVTHGGGMNNHGSPELMRPRLVTWVPAVDGMPGGVRYEAKVDGYRAAGIVASTGAVLRSRRSTDLTGRFPEVAAALAELPPGTVLDGEIVAVRAGRFDFEALQHVRGLRRPEGVTTVFVAFDLLSLAGDDVRDQPLRERVSLLGQLLAGHGPVLQLVLATTDRETALRMYAQLGAVGIEGLVCKALASRYDPRDTSSWCKIRHAETEDARVTGVIGTPDRPSAVLVEFTDGRRAVTSPRLDTLQSRAVAAAVAGRVGEPVRMPGIDAVVCPVAHGPLVEVRTITGRHRTIRLVRVRPAE